MKKFPYLHLFLFTLTFISTLIAGTLQKGINILKEPFRVYEGLPFSLTLLTILLGHELSHYFASMKHNTKATLPYFIPAPPVISPIGTFGAFIKMKSPIITRKALVDIGASGPIAGFLLSVIALIIGLNHSEVVSVTEAKDTAISVSLGNSILFSFLSRLIMGIIPDSHDILLHPIAFAGWIGLFVTSLNLIPIGQLDGGHIAYAFLGEKHRSLSSTLIPVLLILGLFTWEGWMIWGGLMFFLGVKHPPVMYWEVPLDGRRRFTGGLSLLIFIITFIPTPFKIL